MKEKIIMCLVLITSTLYSQDLSQKEVMLEPLTQQEVNIVDPSMPEVAQKVTQPIKAQPLMTQETVQITEEPMSDADQEQFLQDLLNAITPEERAAFEQEAQFLPDRFQPEDLGLNDNAVLSDISDEDLIQLIEALSEQPDLQQFEDNVIR